MDAEYFVVGVCGDHGQILAMGTLEHCEEFYEDNEDSDIFARYEDVAIVTKEEFFSAVETIH